MLKISRFALILLAFAPALHAQSILPKAKSTLAIPTTVSMWVRVIACRVRPTISMAMNSPRKSVFCFPRRRQQLLRECDWRRATLPRSALFRIRQLQNPRAELSIWTARVRDLRKDHALCAWLGWHRPHLLGHSVGYVVRDRPRRRRRLQVERPAGLALPGGLPAHPIFQLTPE